MPDPHEPTDDDDGVIIDGGPGRVYFRPPTDPARSAEHFEAVYDGVMGPWSSMGRRARRGEGPVEACRDDAWDHFASTVIIDWDTDGLPHARTGPWCEPLPAPTVHVVTAANPDGVDATPAANVQAHRRLIEMVEGETLPFSPAVGASPAGTHHELSLLIGGLTRLGAVGLAALHGQLAIFELTDGDLTVVSCTDDREVTRPRRTAPDGSDEDLGSITYGQVIAWRDEHEAASDRTLARLACPVCGTTDPRAIVYGMPTSRPPPWMALGGCIIVDDHPTRECRACSHRWAW